MPGELRVGPWPARQLVAKVVLGKLGEESRRAIQDEIDASRQFLGRQVLDRAEIDADQLCNALERLAVCPLLAARNDRQLPRPERQQFIQRALVRQDVARKERYFVFAKELLSAQAAGSARLPVHLDGFVGRLGHWRISVAISLADES